MSQKHRPRLGSAIASTILSLFSAVSLVEVDKVQAAVLTYNFDVDNGSTASGFFKLNNSSLTGIGIEEIAVSEGRLERWEKDYNLAGATASFEQGVFRGLYASGGYSMMNEYISPPDEPGGPFYWVYESYESWSMGLRYFSWSHETVYRYMNYQSYIDDGLLIVDSYIPYSRGWGSSDVSYTLVDTAAEPVPEPLTVGGTALALAGLTWLKHKKKMAV
ncbi:PEP-CTERM sorting domain-containing protein [Microcoleus sp. D2_18a_D3]|uniref:PEP-CTERM sorting domain-containing protein n=1 Tax=Microcoleus sp. D2_18a_D3 TaxID=3055330 RepID=UPI002FCF0EBA